MPEVSLLEMSREEIDQRFIKVKQRVYRQFQKNPDVDALLFLIGIRELGALPNRKFTKEQKQDLMHIAVCRLFGDLGYYELEGQDQEGWPHWIAVKALPKMDLDAQEYLLKQQIIRYFDRL